MKTFNLNNKSTLLSKNKEDENTSKCNENQLVSEGDTNSEKSDLNVHNDFQSKFVNDVQQNIPTAYEELNKDDEKMSFSSTKTYLCNGCKKTEGKN